MEKKEGIYKLYYYNGQLLEEGNYIDRLRQAIYKSYYDNEQLKGEVDYDDNNN